MGVVPGSCGEVYGFSERINIWQYDCLHVHLLDERKALVREDFDVEYLPKMAKVLPEHFICKNNKFMQWLNMYSSLLNMKISYNYYLICSLNKVTWW